MSKVKLITQEGYGSNSRPYQGDAKVIDLNIEVPDTYDIIGLIRTEFDAETDGGVRVSDELTPAIRHERINYLVGKLLTMIDATFTDAEQRKAMKDLFMKICWDWYEGELAGMTEPWRLDKFPNYKNAFEDTLSESTDMQKRK